MAISKKKTNKQLHRVESLQKRGGGSFFISFRMQHNAQLLQRIFCCCFCFFATLLQDIVEFQNANFQCNSDSRTKTSSRGRGEGRGSSCISLCQQQFERLVAQRPTPTRRQERREQRSRTAAAAGAVIPLYSYPHSYPNSCKISPISSPVQLQKHYTF